MEHKFPQRMKHSFSHPSFPFSYPPLFPSRNFCFSLVVIISPLSFGSCQVCYEIADKSIIYQKIRSRPLRVFSLLQFKLRVQTVINSHRVWIMQPTVQKVPYLKEEVLNEQILSIAYCTIVR